MMRKPVKIHPPESISIRLISEARQRGIPLPEGLKMRDMREPYALEKNKLERKMNGFWRGVFKRQAAQVEYWMNSAFFGRKVVQEIELPEDLIGETDEELRELILLLFEGAGYGLAQMELELALGLDYTLTNVEAAAWARAHAGLLIKRINKTTVEAVRKGLTMFVETPGFTIRDFMDLLPFDEKRSLRVAVTEITNAYAEGQKIAAETAAKQFPDVPMYKQWFTNNDDRVCDICGPLNGQEVPKDQPFVSRGMEFDKPAAHVHCRCWVSYRTRING
jgi:hypothetical protein